MNVDGKMKPPAFANQVAKHEILKGTVFVFAGNSTRYEALINVLRVFARRIAELGGAEIRHFELHGDPALLLIVFESMAHEFQILPEIRRQLANALLLHP